MPHTLRQDDLDFLDRAPVRQIRSAVVDLPIGQVFHELANRPEGWPRWFRVARDCRYESAPPYGVGTLRRMSLRGGLVAQEKVLAWDEDKRFAYRIDDLNAPGFRALMEEWTVERTAEGRTRLQWVFAIEGTKPVQLLLRLGRPALDHVFKQAAHRMANP